MNDAVAHGIEPLLTVSTAPSFAEGPRRPSNIRAGAWKPDPAAFGDFGHALAERYSGTFAGLSRVRYFQAWNEPSLAIWLAPQFVGKRPFSPFLYRRLLNAFYAGVKSAGTGGFVVTAGTPPYGGPRGAPRMRPLLFWRRALCLNKPRKKLKPAKCNQRATFDALAHHPINTAGGPRRSARHPDAASTPDLHKVRRILRKAEKTGRVRPRGRHPLWATEMWWESKPPDPAGVGLKKQARYLAEALYLVWKQRFSVAINYPVIDERGSRATNFKSGVFFASGRPKPALRAFQFPFVTDRKNAAKLVAWGKAPASGRLAIQRKGGGKWRRVKAVRVGAGRVFKTKLRLRGPAKLRARVGSQKSLVWKQKR